QRFNGLMERYPALKAYIEDDLLKAMTTTPIKDKKSDQQKMMIFRAALDGHPGEQLMQGLFELKEYKASRERKEESLNLALVYFESAITNKVSPSYIYNLVLTILPTGSIEDKQTKINFYTSLTLQSAKQGDENGLVDLFQIYSSRIWNA